MTRRVACARCRSHRDLALAPRCFVCGAEVYLDVAPTPGDRTAALERAAAEVVLAAEAIDLELHANKGVLRIHPCARRLAQACRQLALARAGVVA